MYNLIGYDKTTGQKVILKECVTLSAACYIIETNSDRLSNYYLDIENYF